LFRSRYEKPLGGKSKKTRQKKEGRSSRKAKVGSASDEKWVKNGNLGKEKNFEKAGKKKPGY